MGGERPDIRGRTFAFAVRVVKLCRALDSADLAGRRLSGQLLRAGTSVGANVEEAQGAISRREFRCKMLIALKEARESCYWLRLLKAAEVLPAPKLDPLEAEASEITRILGRIAVTTRGKAKVDGGQTTG